MSEVQICHPVKLSDVLDFLVGVSAIPSNFGAQLEAIVAKRSTPEASRTVCYTESLDAKTTKQPVIDARAVSRMEDELIERASVIRCLQEFADLQTGYPLKERRALSRLHRRVSHRTQGELALRALYAYQKWGSNSPERALAEVYAWSRRIQHLEPGDVFMLAQEFRGGEAKRAREEAAELYADSLLVLSAWVGAWNARHGKRARASGNARA